MIIKVWNSLRFNNRKFNLENWSVVNYTTKTRHAPAPASLQFHPRRPRGGQSGREKRHDKRFQVQAEKPLGTDSHRTITERSSECWLLIGYKKCFVLLWPIGEQFLSRYIDFFFFFLFYRFTLCHDGQITIRELKQHQRRRLLKTTLEKWSRAASNFIALIPSRSIRQKLAICSEVEF